MKLRCCSSGGGGSSIRLFGAAFCGTMLSALVMAVPSLPAFLSGLVLYNAFSALLSVLLTEMSAGSTNTWESISAQMSRRVLTAACLFALPNLYDLHPRLPALSVFWIMFVCGGIVGVRICR